MHAKRFFKYPYRTFENIKFGVLYDPMGWFGLRKLIVSYFIWSPVYLHQRCLKAVYLSTRSTGSLPIDLYSHNWEVMSDEEDTCRPKILIPMRFSFFSSEKWAGSLRKMAQWILSKISCNKELIIHSWHIIICNLASIYKPNKLLLVELEFNESRKDSFCRNILSRHLTFHLISYKQYLLIAYPKITFLQILWRLVWN